MMSQLADYPAAGNEDAARFRQLRTELEQHWAGLNQALVKAGLAHRGVFRETGPLRVSELKITEEVENEDAGQTATTMHRWGIGLKTSVVNFHRCLNLALAAALVVAVGCTVYVHRIERMNRHARVASRAYRPVWWTLRKQAAHYFRANSTIRSEQTLNKVQVDLCY